MTKMGPGATGGSSASAAVLLFILALACRPAIGAITPQDLDVFISQTIVPGAAAADMSGVGDALNEHVQEMVAAGRLMPLVIVTGKTKVYAFDHPRELFQGLSMALPYLKPEVRVAAIKYLDGEYAAAPPFDAAHYKMTGRPRCAGGNYDSVVEGSQTVARTERPDMGMYAFWAYCRYADRKDVALRDWSKVEEAMGWAKQRSEKLLKGSPAAKFLADLGGKAGYDEGHRADGRAVVEMDGLINGLIGIARLAEMAGHPQQMAEAKQLLPPLIEERMKFPIASGTYLRGWEPVLWYEMTPELLRLIAREQGDAIHHYMDDQPAGESKFNSRFSRNKFWHLAWGEGCETDEMAVAMPQVTRALYGLRVFLHQDSPAELERLSDMPWCMGDLYFIEKLTDTLWAAGGRKWGKANP